jgi:hypothetical protein
LHRFRVHGKDYGIAYLGGMSFDDDPLSRFRLHPRESFRYEYDFTANWRVDIRLEEILPQDQRVLPVCAGGRAAAPGEEYAGALERRAVPFGSVPGAKNLALSPHRRSVFPRKFLTRCSGCVHPVASRGSW